MSEPPSGYTKPHVSLDSFQNFLTKTGINANNLSSGGSYGFNPVTRNRVQMEWCYRGSWIAGMAVDTVAEDMTREGVEIQCGDSPEDIEQLHKEAERLQIWTGICDTIKWSRLYGGALGFLMIDGQDTSTPLNLDTITQGQFKGILPLDRWMVQPSLQNLVTDFGPEFGLPKFYDVLPDSNGMPYMRIHHSRVIRLIGVKLSYWQRIAEMLWGQSVLERLWDRLIAFDSATTGTAQLVYKAHLRTIAIKDLRKNISAGGPAEAALRKNIDFIRQYQSNEGLTLLDAEDRFEVSQYGFAGLADVLLQFGQQISGALEIPLVRLFGQSPAGLNSTGESDWQNYDSGIKKRQETSLRPGVEKTYHALYRSTFGRAPVKAFTLIFNPLRELSEEQKANITNIVTTAITDAYNAQIIDRGAALSELRRLSTVTGAYSSITDEQITDAENEMPPTPGELGVGADPDTGSAEGKQQPPESDKDEPGRKDVSEAAPDDRASRRGADQRLRAA